MFKQKLPIIEEQIRNLVTDDPSIVEASLEKYSDFVCPDNMSIIQRYDICVYLFVVEVILFTVFLFLIRGIYCTLFLCYDLNKNKNYLYLFQFVGHLCSI